MPYDYQLVGGTVLVLLSLVGITNAMVERRSPLFGIIAFLMGVGLLVWGWLLSGWQMNPSDLPAAVYRLIAEWK
ncbi:hypothetical protein [Neptunicoccus sediminis]|uniref:hypothetical protein n=1 Tax=Neptunicoccus sediminis TaxID=1892596 RepID=UPI000845E943|nr:hypothetical protein [Neptunicoccus sediminis]